MLWDNFVCSPENWKNTNFKFNWISMDLLFIVYTPMQIKSYSNSIYGRNTVLFPFYLHISYLISLLELFYENVTYTQIRVKYIYT